MDFTEATDRLTSCATHEEIAAEAGVSVQSIRVARLARSSRNYRPPPRNWRDVLARIARRRAAELTRLADELEREVKA